MNVRKTVFQKAMPRSRTRRQAGSSTTQQLSSTMPIPTEAVFDELASRYEHFIQVEIPGQSPTRLKLDREPLILGRDASCDVRLKLVNVSRQHAHILLADEDYIVEDMNSTNGTFVNNVKISRCVLRDHDQIRIGEARILFLKRQVRASP